VLDGKPDDFLVSRFEFTSHDSYLKWFDAFVPEDPVGTVDTLGSRLVPRSAGTDANTRSAAVATLTFLASKTAVKVVVIGGGAVGTADPDYELTSVTPAWRTALFHVEVKASCTVLCTNDERAAMFALVSAWTSLLREVFPLPDSGAYFSEADYLEPDWQLTFWGENYERLRVQSIKVIYDPRGVLDCHHCVQRPSPRRRHRRRHRVAQRPHRGARRGRHPHRGRRLSRRH
jgi:hypothetical protein